jgi:FixJ family two-component response regulator
MKTPFPIIYIVEHDPSMLATLRGILQDAGFRLDAFTSPKDLHKVRKHTDAPSCVIVDLDLPRGHALPVQRYLKKTYPGVPVIFISARPDIPASVKAIKAGALDVLITPLNPQRLLKLIHKALLQERRFKKDCQDLANIRRRLDTLTARETEVLECLLKGLLNKQTAAKLGISEKTIKVHRGRVMKKMQVQSIAELVQLVMRLRGIPLLSHFPSARGSSPSASATGP